MFKNLCLDFIKNYKNNGNYRNFVPINKNKNGITFHYLNNCKTIWSGNDYMIMSQNECVKKKAIETIEKYGIGTGGTRNIGGSTPSHFRLEKCIANFHNKESGLIFNSGFSANYSTFQSFGKLFPNAQIYSDRDNHASMIHGIRASGLEKKIFKHNNMDDLESLLKKSTKMNIIAIESIYSMDGSKAPLDDLCFLAKKYNALTFIDEIHAVGVYGESGAGITELEDHQNKFDIIMGGFGKAFGTIGGYITGDNHLIDSIRLLGASFIFTTSTPSHISESTIKSIEVIKKSQRERDRLFKNVNYFNDKLKENNIETIETNYPESHIIAILIGDSNKCNWVCKKLFEDFHHYVQPINFPTVPQKTERLRINVTGYHTEEMIDHFIESLLTLLSIKYEN